MSKEKGEYIRNPTSYHNVISNSSEKFKVEKNRYHLYVSYSCPWANRTLILRSLKGLEEVITASSVDPQIENIDIGWSFTKENPDPINGFKTLSQVYKQDNKEYVGRFTVPVLYDKKLKLIVNNESSEIIRILNSNFNEFATKNKKVDYYPESLRKEIDEVNAWIYDKINNGVYKCGFAKNQSAYDQAFDELFDALEKVESILSKKRYLTGSTLTEADIRLFVTLIRFDLVYFSHFKCNYQMIRDYPNMWGYVKEIYQIPEVKKTINFDYVKRSYYYSQVSQNPFRIIPKGPKAINFDEEHGRDKKKYEEK